MILLFKKGDAADLGNWRPLSLINADAKLFTKIITLHLRTPLDRLGLVVGVAKLGRALFVLIPFRRLVVLLLDRENGIDGIQGCFSLGSIGESNRSGFGRRVAQAHLPVEDVLPRFVCLSCDVTCEVSDRAGECNCSVLPYVISVIIGCHGSEGVQRAREMDQSSLE